MCTWNRQLWYYIRKWMSHQLCSTGIPAGVRIWLRVPCICVYSLKRIRRWKSRSSRKRQRCRCLGLMLRRCDVYVLTSVSLQGEYECTILDKETWGTESNRQLCPFLLSIPELMLTLPDTPVTRYGPIFCFCTQTLVLKKEGAIFLASAVYKSPPTLWYCIRGCLGIFICQDKWWSHDNIRRSVFKAWVVERKENWKSTGVRTQHVRTGCGAVKLNVKTLWHPGESSQRLKKETITT